MRIIVILLLAALLSGCSHNLRKTEEDTVKKIDEAWSSGVLKEDKMDSEKTAREKKGIREALAESKRTVVEGSAERDKLTRELEAEKVYGSIGKKVLGGVIFIGIFLMVVLIAWIAFKVKRTFFI